MGEPTWGFNLSYLWAPLSPILRDQWFSTGDHFALRGHLAMSGDTCGRHNLGRGEWPTDIRWEEAKAAVKHPIMHRTAPQQRIIQFQMSIVLSLRNPGLD